MKPLIRLARNVCLIFSTGYVLFFYSERVFWSFFRPGDSFFDILLTWVAYSVLGWIFLVCIHSCRIHTFPGVFLSGALFGWMGEGGLVTTLYGSPDNPFPISISWTGLAWHALLTIGVGWYATLTAFVSPNWKRSFTLSLSIGLVWGLWGVFWPSELGSTCDTSPTAFLLHSICFGGLLPLAWLGIRYSGQAVQQWGNKSWWAMVALVVLIIAIRIIATPEAAWILPVLVGIVFIALSHWRKRSTGPDSILLMATGFPKGRVLWFLLAPLVSSASYACLWHVDQKLPTNVLLFLITTPLGFIVFGWCLWKCWTLKGNLGNP